MDTQNPVIKLCMEGTQAEFAGNRELACDLYRQAWRSAGDDYEACVAAHYVARCQVKPEDILHWNREALRRANAVRDDRVKEFLPSLHINMGRACELNGDPAEAERFYKLAADAGLVHDGDGIDRRSFLQDHSQV